MPCNRGRVPANRRRAGQHRRGRHGVAKACALPLLYSPKISVSGRKCRRQNGGVVGGHIRCVGGIWLRICGSGGRITNAAFDTGGEGWTVTPTAFGTTAIQDVSGFDVDRSGFSRASQVVWGIREFCCREHFPPLWEAFSMSVSMSVSHPVTRLAHKTSMRGNSRCW